MKQRKQRTIMMMALTALLLICAAALSGCGESKPQTATLTLPSNPTTGYSWRVEQEPELFEITSEYAEDAETEGLVGAGGSETFTLTPKEAGDTEISFYYEQAWDKDSLAERLTYKISVDDNMQISVEAQSGEVPGDESTVPEMPELEIK